MLRRNPVELLGPEARKRLRSANDQGRVLALALGMPRAFIQS